MPPESGAAESGALSVDAATSLLNTRDDDAPQASTAPAPAPVAAAAEETGTPESEAAPSAAEDAPAEAETQTQEGDEGEETEQAETPLEAPLYWSQEDKARFAELPPELQAVVLKQEGPREAAAAKAKDEAQQVRTKADQEIAGIQKFAEELSGFLPRAVQMFRSRWGDNPDWVAFAQQHGAEQMSVAKAQFEAEKTTLQQLAQASDTAEREAHQAYVATEFQTLQKIAPDLADPEKGPARRTEITKYLVDAGIPKQAIAKISAVEMSMAHKAMLWDQSKAKSALQPAPKPAPAATKPLARGAASTGSADPKTKQVQTARRAFGQTRSINDAVAVLSALED